MRALRNLGDKTSPLLESVSSAIKKVIDPESKYMEFYEFADDKANRWATPLIEYSAGDESDNTPMYEVVNHELRSGKAVSKTSAKWVTDMRKAMWRLPKYEGLVFRGTRLTAERIAKYYQLDKPATDSAFISTSMLPETAFSFARWWPNRGKEKPEKIAVVFIISGKTGRPVSSFAHMHEHEQEILFANGSPMTVKAMSPVFIDAELGKTQIISLVEP